MFFWVYAALFAHTMIAASRKMVMRKSGLTFPPLSLYKPKTHNQQLYVNHLDDDQVKIVVAVGPAGTGKTLFACQHALTLLKTGLVKKVVLTRPVVTVEEDIGFLPGSLTQKMDPWTKPLFDIFMEAFSKTELDLLVKNEIIEICPLAFMRGRTFKHAIIIADEMQNSSPNQMKMMTTRLGINSKLVVTGDLEQTDLVARDNGLRHLLMKLNAQLVPSNMIQVVDFVGNDIERSEIVKTMIDIYNN